MLLVVCQLGRLQFNFSHFTQQVTLCFVEKKKRNLFGLKKCKKSLYSAGNCRLRFSGVYLCWALAILSRPAMSWNVTCFVEENKEDKEWFLAWPRKKVPHTYDAHLSDVLSYLVHLQVIHEARRRLASKRKWKITRMKQKKKGLSTPGNAHFSVATRHASPSCLCSTRITTVPLFCKISCDWKNKFI